MSGFLAKHRNYTHHPTGSLPEGTSVPRQVNECNRLISPTAVGR
jgi:hypothetical protein